MLNKPRLLIVDDVSSNIHLLMSVLKDDYTIIAATNGKKALELAQSHPTPDLILLDVVMPDMDGFEVCKELKRSTVTKEIPIVFVTSLNSIEEQEQGLEAGGIDFISKPFSKDIILHKVETYLNLKELETSCGRTKPVELKEEPMNEQKSKVLVVDDSPENIQVAIEALKDKYTVSVATSGMKALRQIDEGLLPDLILLDVIMPEMDGYELCEILKAREEFKYIPIIFVTVLEKENDIVRGLELGAVDYVVKPIEPQVLNARVETHLKVKKYHDTLVEDIKTKDELIYNQSKLAILGEMFENITHQWRQPLSAISVTTSGIKLEQEFGNLNNDGVIKGLDTIESSVKYLSQTVDDFRNFILSERSERAFDIKELVEKTLRLLESRFKNSAISVENRVESFELNSQQNDLIQILMNLLSNAQDALVKKENERKIVISSEIQSNDFIIRIEDNGGGIDIDPIEKIFEKYFTTKGDKGSGIGLFMSRKIAWERLGGDLKVYNVTNGVCFEIILPIV